MALTQINYTNKETLNPQPTVEDKNKVTASDMNEIKSVVNDACSQIDTNTSDISTNADNIATNTGNISTNTNNISTINTKITGMIKRSSMTVTGVYVNQGYSVSATVPQGYVFLCWLNPSSTGSVNGAYMEEYWKQTTNIWQTTSNSQNTTFTCPYLMIKDGFLG